MSEPSDVLSAGVDVDLTKWPRLLVTGDVVTREQASEIILRTTQWYLSTNDKQWRAEVYAALVERGAPATLVETESAQDLMSVEFSQALSVWTQISRTLDLAYLHNDRIASAWIGGSKGWVTWGGQVGASTYNIGKYPSVEYVHRDLLRIAVAFPFLRMEVQLVTDEGQGRPAVRWVVSKGDVSQPEIGEQTLITQVMELTDERILARLTGASGERGVDLATLRAALGRLDLSYV